ncbi:hypothetical protein JTB14_008989 [Gonioctena quinquepunctata]|nr:hypothetical protein JTB14_008989 [Gonioctena quinquepunctata]
MRCLENYIFKVDERFTTLLKRGKTHPKQLKKTVLSNEKKKDVASLLDIQFGGEWRELEEFNWFKELLDIREGIIITDEEMNECDCLELECEDCRI